MSSEISLYKVKSEKLQKVLNEDLTKIYILSTPYYQDNINLELYFQNQNKLHCYELMEMFSYYFLDFKWDGKLNIKNEDNIYLLDFDSTLNLIEWFLALSFTFRKEDVQPNILINDKYLLEAERLKNEYKPNYEYFSYSFEKFSSLKECMLNESNKYNYLWIHSI